MVNLVFYIERSPHLGIVCQLGEAFFYFVAERNFLKISLSNFVLGFYPLGCRLAIIVLEPAIRVGNLSAKVVVYNIDCFSLGVVDFLLCYCRAGNHECCAHNHVFFHFIAVKCD